MQLAKIRRKTQPVKKIFYEIWKIAVDLGGFGARRPGRCGARAVGADARRGARWGARGGRWAARPGAVRRERWAAGRRRVRGDEESCRVQARRGHGARGGASTAGHKRGAGTASGTAGRARRAGRDGGADAAGYKRGSGRGGGGTVSGTRRVARGRGENHASSPHPSDEPPRARSFSHPDGISDESDAFWAFMRFAAAQFDQSQAKSPSPAPNPVHSHPFCRIAECGSDLDEGGEQRRSNRREDDDTRGRGRRYTRARAMHEGGGDAGAKHDEAAAQGRNAAPKSLERSANQTRIAQTPRRRTQPNRNNSVWRRLKSGFWIRTRILRCRLILHAIRAISTGLSS